MKIEDRMIELEEKLKKETTMLEERKMKYYTRDDFTEELKERVENIKLKIINSSLLYLENLKYLEDISVSLKNIDKYLSKERGKMLGEINSLTIDNHSLFEKNEKLKRGMI